MMMSSTSGTSRSVQRPALNTSLPPSSIQSSGNTTLRTPTNMIDLTQESEQEEVVEEEHLLVASCHCDIVGIRYYSGTAHTGEFVTLRREPHNPYDRNAIRIDNMNGAKVGHIKREQAKLLASFMDDADVLGLSFEGTIPSPGNSFSLPCTTDFYAVAPTEQLQRRAQKLAKKLKSAFQGRFKFKSGVALPPPPTAPTVAAPHPPQVENKTMDWQTQAKELDDMFEKQSAEQLLNLPDIEIPSQLKTELLDYQREGVKWLVHQETNAKNLPFFKKVREKGKKVWLCEITNCSQQEPPKAVHGGILADEMGLGKTLQAITLMLAATPTEKSAPACTLIVCPVSVMSNWDQQIRAHVASDILKLGFYQGANRANLLPQVKDGSINVLLVSYHTLASEYTKAFGKKKDGAPAAKRIKTESIFDSQFHRILLDEAHMIRSSKTTFFHAVKQVQADRKWALTGTPFVNRADDIHSLLAFLGVEPLCDKGVYRRAVTMPIQNGNELGLTRLRAIMAHVALRRSKATAKVELVQKTVQLSSITFEDNSPHTAVYDALFGSFRMAFQAVLQEGESGVLKNYSSIFEKLLRMRQSCCSALLVPRTRRVRAIELWKELKERDGLTAEEGLELLEKLKGTFTQEDDCNELPECAVCLTEMEEHQCVILRTCAHVYCETCISRVCSNHDSNCPLCRKPFTKSDLVKKCAATVAATQDAEQEVLIDDEDIGPSPKILALLEAIKAMKPDEKGVIFSQFTSFLNLIQNALKEAGHSYTRLDGSMSSTKRMEAVRSFCSDEEGSPRFILCSLHAAGTGINLTRGNHAFMMDCWWNQAVENQAMDRIHRIGQQREVRVIRFVMKNSLEERIVALQEAKGMQAKGSMQKLKADEQRKARLSDLKGLLLLDEK